MAAHSAAGSGRALSRGDRDVALRVALIGVAHIRTAVDEHEDRIRAANVGLTVAVCVADVQEHQPRARDLRILRLVWHLAEKTTALARRAKLLATHISRAGIDLA